MAVRQSKEFRIACCGPAPAKHHFVNVFFGISACRAEEVGKAAELAAKELLANLGILRRVSELIEARVHELVSVRWKARKGVASDPLAANLRGKEKSAQQDDQGA